MNPLPNIFESIPAALPVELVETLRENKHLRIERIVSRGHASPEGFWYDQPAEEWVLLVQGAAKLRFESEGTSIELRAGDWLTIPAHTRHRVEWTSPDEPTIWLAVYFDGGISEAPRFPGRIDVSPLPDFRVNPQPPSQTGDRTPVG